MSTFFFLTQSAIFLIKVSHWPLLFSLVWIKSQPLVRLMGLLNWVLDISSCPPLPPNPRCHENWNLACREVNTEVYLNLLFLDTLPGSLSQARRFFLCPRNSIVLALCVAWALSRSHTANPNGKGVEVGTSSPAKIQAHHGVLGGGVSSLDLCLLTAK